MECRKNSVRKEFIQVRKSLSLKRRKEASLAALKILVVENTIPILSFASFKHEIDLWPLNEELAKRKRLLLPKMTQEGLTLYWVDDIKKLIPNSLGLLEPDPNNFQIYSSKSPILALIPGVAFDQKNNRLGLGKGYYDRFLKGASYVLKWGIGFREQLCEALPVEDHDVPMDKVLYY